MRSNSKLIAALILVLMVAGGVAFLLQRPTGIGGEMAIGSAANPPPVDSFVPAVSSPDFSAAAPLDPAGKPVDMAAYRGKALLVNLWATWCAPCIKELPSLGKLQESLGGADFAVLTIALDEPDAAKVAPFLAQHGAANLSALIDTNRTIDKVMPVSALPTSLLVDKDGKVRAVLTGDAEWHCGAALQVVKAFVADGTIKQDKLAPCS